MGKTLLHVGQAETILSILDLLFSRPKFISIGYSCLEGGREYDLFARALLEFAKPHGSTMAILRRVLLSEFQDNVATPTAIMRGNSATSRIMGIYCRQEGAAYLRNLLGDIVDSIVAADVDFEVQREKLDSDEQHTRNMAALQACATRILEHVTSEEAVSAMPRNIRALAAFISEFASEFTQENRQLLVGGFIMLRLINPSILAPDAFGICQTPPSMKGRRNLTLVCKLIQGVSNKRLFNEDWMLACNPWMEEHLNDLDSYFARLVVDPELEEGGKPFASVLQQKEGVDSHANVQALSFASYEFMHGVFLEQKEPMLEGLEAVLAQEGIKEETLELVELINDYEEIPVEEAPMDLYFSALCPYSRATWFFCRTNELKMNYHKLDLFTEDHGLDMLYKKFIKLSPSKQVPLLVDGDLVIEESHAIVAYLSSKYLMASHWFPRSSPQQEAIVHQFLDWSQINLQLPLLRLWRAVQKPKADGSNLTAEHYPDLLEGVKKLEAMYPTALHLVEGKPAVSAPKEMTSTYLLGKKPSIVDLMVVTMLNFAQVVQGFTVCKYKNLTRLITSFIKENNTLWQEVSYEFEGLLNYVVTVTTRNSAPQVKQHFVFQQIPTTVFELILDPENDIFLVLASKTISTKTNAKMKQGLKKLDSGAANSDSDGESSLPYVVSLDIGGHFNVQGREGTNLLLVSGSKILQVSRMGTWPSGLKSTELFDLVPCGEGHTLMTLTQFNYPPEKQKEQEDHWVRMWKKLNGVRTGQLKQTVYFKGKTPAHAFVSLSDWRVFGKMTKAKVKLENDCFSLFGGKVTGQVTEIVNPSFIKQTWRASDWPEDHSGVATMAIEEFEGGSRVQLTVDLVPWEKLAAVGNFWRSNVWKKFGSVIVEDLEQTVFFPQPVDDIYRLWLDESAMTQRLKTKCSIEKGVGGVFLPYGIKCIFTALEKNARIAFSFSHKDWPTSHVSMVELRFKAIKLGDTETTEVHLSHRNVPAKFSKTTFDLWKTDFWDKLEAVQTTDLAGTVLLRSIGPEQLYKTILDTKSLSTLTGSSCNISALIGSAYYMYNKSVKGQVVQLEPYSKIVLTMRDFEWPYSHLSTFTIRLGEMDAGKGTLLTYTQEHVPISKASECSDRWGALLETLTNKYK